MEVRMPRQGQMGGGGAHGGPEGAAGGPEGRRRQLRDASDALPDFPTITSLDDDEGTVVAADTDDKLEDITKPASETDEANPYGAIVRVAGSGHAVWNDMSHCIVASPDGSLTISDRETGGDSDPIVNCVIKNNMITYHNPNFPADPKAPEYLTCPLNPKGTELKLSDGTTVFIEPQPNGTCDVTIVSVDPKVPANGTDPHPGVMTSFKGLGSGEPFESGKNPTGAEIGGAEFKRKWEERHDAGGFGGTNARLWVTPMTADEPSGKHSFDRIQGTQKENAEFDKQQRPGGISQRSNKSYEVDVKDSWKDRKRLIWHDLIGVDASKPPAEMAKEFEGYIGISIIYRNADEMKQQHATLAALKGPDTATIDMLNQSKEGTPLFDTPTDPAAEKSIFGDGTVSGGKKPDGADGGDADPEDSGSEDGGGTTSSRSGSGPITLGDLFAAQIRRQLQADANAENRRREEARAA